MTPDLLDIGVDGLSSDDLVKVAGDIRVELAKRAKAHRAEGERLTREAERDAPTRRKRVGRVAEDVDGVERLSILAFAREHGDSKAAKEFGLTSAWVVKRLRASR